MCQTEIARVFLVQKCRMPWWTLDIQCTWDRQQTLVGCWIVLKPFRDPPLGVSPLTSVHTRTACHGRTTASFFPERWREMDDLLQKLYKLQTEVMCITGRFEAIQMNRSVCERKHFVCTLYACNSLWSHISFSFRMDVKICGNIAQSLCHGMLALRVVLEKYSASSDERVQIKVATRFNTAPWLELFFCNEPKMFGHQEYFLFPGGGCFLRCGIRWYDSGRQLWSNGRRKPVG